MVATKFYMKIFEQFSTGGSAAAEDRPIKKNDDKVTLASDGTVRNRSGIEVAQARVAVSSFTCVSCVR